MLRGLKPIVTGLILGLATAASLTRLIGELLFGVSPTDPTTLFSMTALLFAAAFVACAVPVRRALAINPIETLRHE
jgi:putative ABC transport system permease protein